MKLVLGILIGVLLALQLPMAWQALQKAQQCDQSVAKQVSNELAKAHPDLDVVNCSFIHFYKGEWSELLGAP